MGIDLKFEDVNLFIYLAIAIAAGIILSVTVNGLGASAACVIVSLMAMVVLDHLQSVGTLTFEDMFIANGSLVAFVITFLFVKALKLQRN